MAKYYQTMEFCRDTYEHEDGLDEYELWEDMCECMKILIKNDYVLKIFDDGVTISIEYTFADPKLAGTTLQWVGDDETVVSFDSSGDIKTV